MGACKKKWLRITPLCRDFPDWSTIYGPDGSIPGRIPLDAFSAPSQSVIEPFEIGALLMWAMQRRR